MTSIANPRDAARTSGGTSGNTDRGCRATFIEVAHGQVHARVAAPATSNAPPLLMLHGAGGSSKSFERLLQVLGRERPVVALDMPGQGESDPPPRGEAVTMTGYADIMLQVADALGLSRFDVYGRHTGARIGIEIAIARPSAVRACVFDGLTPAAHGTMESLRQRYPETSLAPNGAHLYEAWHKVRDSYLFRPWNDRRAATRRIGGLPSADRLHDHVLEAVKGMMFEPAIHLASASYPVDVRLPMVTAPTLLIAAPTDTSFDCLADVGRLVPHADVEPYPCDNYDYRASDAEILMAADMIGGWLTRLEATG